MTRTWTRRPRRAAVASLALLGAALAGCGGDDSEPRADDPTTTAASPATSSGDPSPTDAGTDATSDQTTAPTSPSVAPATGIELMEETSALRVPEGWEATEPLVDFASSASGPGRDDSVQLADRPSLAGDTTLDSLAQTALEGFGPEAHAQRLPDVDLAGSPAYVITYKEPGFPSLNWDVVTLRNGRSIAVNFILDEKSLQQDPQLMESVLASFRWLD